MYNKLDTTRYLKDGDVQVDIPVFIIIKNSKHEIEMNLGIANLGILELNPHIPKFLNP
jgi:hypothetical protein